MPVPGTSVFFTVKLGTGFVTVDVQWFGGDARACGDGGRVLHVGRVGGGHVGCEGHLHRVAGGQGDVDGHLGCAPVTVAVQVSVAAIVVHFTAVAARVRFEAMVSFEDREPAPEPVFFTVIV